MGRSDAIKIGISLRKIHEITRIDMWYLKQFEEMVETEKLVSGYTIGTIPRNVLMEAKMKGFADPAR